MAKKTKAGLNELVRFYKEKIAVLKKVKTPYANGLLTAYMIAKKKTLKLISELEKV